MFMVHLSFPNHQRLAHVCSRPYPASLCLSTDVYSIRCTDIPCLTASTAPCVSECKPVYVAVALEAIMIFLHLRLLHCCPHESSHWSSLGFFVPYFERAVTRLPTPPYTTTVSTISFDLVPHAYNLPNQKRL